MMPNRCLVCNSPLPEGVDYCPAGTFKPGLDEILALEFGGCYEVRFEAIWHPSRLCARRYVEGVKPKTDAARFREAYGLDCLPSVHGPLPSRSEGKTGADPKWMRWE